MNSPRFPVWYINGPSFLASLYMVFAKISCHETQSRDIRRGPQNRAQNLCADDTKQQLVYMNGYKKIKGQYMNGYKKSKDSI